MGGKTETLVRDAHDHAFVLTQNLDAPLKVAAPPPPPPPPPSPPRPLHCMASGCADNVQCLSSTLYITR